MTQPYLEDNFSFHSLEKNLFLYLEEETEFEDLLKELFLTEELAESSARE